MSTSHNPNPNTHAPTRRNCFAPPGWWRAAMPWRRRFGFGLWVVCVGMLSLTSAGCAKARAEMVADGPPLEVPAPPDRLIGQIDDTLTGARVPLGPPDPQGVAAAPATPPASTPRPRATARPPDTESREPASSAAPAAAAPATPPPPAVADAARDLRSSGDVEAANRVSGLLQRARADLKGVDPRKLSPDNKAQYEEATRFAQRADEEVKARNFIFAETFADKAATLAAQLIGR